ncbi:MAG: ORF6N domain-containing protein [Candidatus Marinimicrobia bacterium]|nr:ORF6N domain-containing protein [Candidatus Neomarinimicrobiota bacterium]
MRQKRQEVAVAPDLQDRIFTVRGEKVILDSDLAEIYGVETKILNMAVARNLKRFPPDHAFRLTQQERTNLRF